MDFINSQVDVSTLPAAEEIHLHPIHPAYKKILLIEWVITTLFFVLVAGALVFLFSSLRNSYGWMILSASALFLSLVHLISVHKSFPFKAFAVRDKDVMYRKGWINRSIKIIPFNRIQNCSVQSGPLERKHGLASLVVYTAGAESADMKIPGLLQEEADRLRHFIMEKIHGEPDETV
jgi:uncharacterized protein